MGDETTPLAIVARIAREVSGPAADAVDREARFPDRKSVG